MQYLIPSDYEFQLRDDIQNALDDGSTTRLAKAELAAVAIVTDRLSRLYDISKILFPVKAWTSSLLVKTGELVYHKTPGLSDEHYLVYEAIQDSTGMIPADNATFYQLTDKRNPMVIMYLIDLVVFHYHAADAQGAMPEEIEERHKQAMKYFDQVGAGTLHSSLPQRTLSTDNEHYQLRYMSHPVENQRY